MIHSIGGRENNINDMISYIVKNNIPGDILDIGVFKGYSSYLALNKLNSLGINDREFYLYDTFEGMPLPTPEDGKNIINIHKRETNNSKTNSSKWAFGSLTEVKNNLKNVKYPKDKIHYVKGMVENTLPNHSHKQIAYMRLDTDFYSSTKIELECLYPYLSEGGVVIVDDYDSKFKGCNLAVHEFFDANNISRSLITKIRQLRCGMYFIKPKKSKNE